MNLLSGLEKFGLKAEDTTNLFAEEKKEVVGEDGTKQEAAPTEDSFLLDKAVRCAVCDKVFKTKMIKSGRLKRLESDMDLRPRYEHIDTLKYSVISCPYCGYTAITRYFEHLSSMQVKMIKEKICVNFKPADNVEPTLIDYDTAIERYKLALFNTIVKKGKTSEKAYTCLNLAWLLRGKRESLDAKDPKMAEQIKECRDECTMDYLLATMAYHYKKYDVASKCIARILQSAAASKKMKDRAYELKERIVEEIKRSKA